MDNTRGYVADNCVACCKTCNYMKGSLDARTFVERCGQISAYHEGPGEGPVDCFRSAHVAVFVDSCEQDVQAPLLI